MFCEIWGLRIKPKPIKKFYSVCNKVASWLKKKERFWQNWKSVKWVENPIDLEHIVKIDKFLRNSVCVIWNVSLYFCWIFFS